MKALFDTHILIDYLQGRVEAKREIELYESRLISAVSVMEILTLAEGESLPTVQAWLKQFTLVPLDSVVAEQAATLRKRYGVGAEAALVWASAKTQSALFVTCNTDDYPAGDVSIRKPY